MFWNFPHSLRFALAMVIVAMKLPSCNVAVVQEEQVTSCNTPCDMMHLTCPARHRMAIREALYSVTARPASDGPCPLVHTCGTDTTCCERSESQDCVFTYSPSHLEAVHRNCSGSRTCAVKTQRSREESVACPFFRPDSTVSHTVLDYVCINESSIVDICMPSERTVQGRTLFTLLDSQRWRDPLSGAVCRCTAESVRWPTTNTIAVFVVDMRLNTLRQSHCSKADMTLKSGPTTRHLDCASSRDPRQVFPFTALLNHSNVATVELFLHTQLPEFVWIGFESNELEDIRLTCGLQGYVPIFHDVDDDSKDRNNGTETNVKAGTQTGASVAAITGGVAGGVVLCAVVAVVIIGVLLYRSRRSPVKVEDYADPHDAVDDIDVYYSTPGLPNATSVQNQSVTSPSSMTSAQANDDGEVYVTAQAVREKKHGTSKKTVGRLSMTPALPDESAEDYAAPWDVRHNQQQTILNLTRDRPPLPSDMHSDPPPLPPILATESACEEEGEDYDMLHTTRMPTQEIQTYDRLHVSPRPATPMPGIKRTSTLTKKSTPAQTPSPKETKTFTRTPTPTQTPTPTHMVSGRGEECENNCDESGDDDYSDITFLHQHRPEPDGCNYNTISHPADKQHNTPLDKGKELV